MKKSHIRRLGFTLIELLIILAVIAILVALLLPMYNAARARRTFVDFGRHYTIDPVPALLIGTDGWIRPEDVREHVYNALTMVVGQIDPTRTINLTKWSNKDSKGERYEAIGGEFTTVLVPTRKEVQIKLSTIANAAALTPYTYRQVRVRYWTEAANKSDKPGGFYLAMETRISGSTTGLPFIVRDADAEAILLEDVVVAIKNPSPVATPSAPSSL